MSISDKSNAEYTPTYSHDVNEGDILNGDIISLDTGPLVDPSPGLPLQSHSIPLSPTSSFISRTSDIEPGSAGQSPHHHHLISSSSRPISEHSVDYHVHDGIASHNDNTLLSTSYDGGADSVIQSIDTHSSCNEHLYPPQDSDTLSISLLPSSNIASPRTQSNNHTHMFGSSHYDHDITTPHHHSSSLFHHNHIRRLSDDNTTRPLLHDTIHHTITTSHPDDTSNFSYPPLQTDNNDTIINHHGIHQNTMDDLSSHLHRDLMAHLNQTHNPLAHQTKIQTPHPFRREQRHHYSQSRPILQQTSDDMNDTAPSPMIIETQPSAYPPPLPLHSTPSAGSLMHEHRQPQSVKVPFSSPLPPIPPSRVPIENKTPSPSPRNQEQHNLSMDLQPSRSHHRPVPDQRQTGLDILSSSNSDFIMSTILQTTHPKPPAPTPSRSLLQHSGTAPQVIFTSPRSQNTSSHGLPPLPPPQRSSNYTTPDDNTTTPLPGAPTDSTMLSPPQDSLVFGFSPTFSSMVTSAMNSVGPGPRPTPCFPSNDGDDGDVSHSTTSVGTHTDHLHGFSLTSTTGSTTTTSKSAATPHKNRASNSARTTPSTRSSHHHHRITPTSSSSHNLLPSMIICDNDTTGLYENGMYMSSVQHMIGGTNQHDEHDDMDSTLSKTSSQYDGDQHDSENRHDQEHPSQIRIIPPALSAPYSFMPPTTSHIAVAPPITALFPPGALGPIPSPSLPVPVPLDRYNPLSNPAGWAFFEDDYITGVLSYHPISYAKVQQKHNNTISIDPSSLSFPTVPNAIKIEQDMSDIRPADTSITYESIKIEHPISHTPSHSSSILHNPLLCTITPILDPVWATCGANLEFRSQSIPTIPTGADADIDADASHDNEKLDVSSEKSLNNTSTTDNTTTPTTSTTTIFNQPLDQHTDDNHHTDDDGDYAIIVYTSHTMLQSDCYKNHNIYSDDKSYHDINTTIPWYSPVVPQSSSSSSSSDSYLSLPITPNIIYDTYLSQKRELYHNITSYPYALPSPLYNALSQSILSLSNIITTTPSTTNTTNNHDTHPTNDNDNHNSNIQSIEVAVPVCDPLHDDEPAHDKPTHDNNDTDTIIKIERITNSTDNAMSSNDPSSSSHQSSSSSHQSSSSSSSSHQSSSHVDLFNTPDIPTHYYKPIIGTKHFTSWYAKQRFKVPHKSCLKMSSFSNNISIDDDDIITNQYNNNTNTTSREYKEHIKQVSFDSICLPYPTLDETELTYDHETRLLDGFLPPEPCSMASNHSGSPISPTQLQLSFSSPSNHITFLPIVQTIYIRDLSHILHCVNDIALEYEIYKYLVPPEPPLIPSTTPPIPYPPALLPPKPANQTIPTLLDKLYAADILEDPCTATPVWVHLIDINTVQNIPHTLHHSSSYHNILPITYTPPPLSELSPLDLVSLDSIDDDCDDMHDKYVIYHDCGIVYTNVDAHTYLKYTTIPQNDYHIILSAHNNDNNNNSNNIDHDIVILPQSSSSSSGSSVASRLKGTKSSKSSYPGKASKSSTKLSSTKSFSAPSLAGTDAPNVIGANSLSLVPCGIPGACTQHTVNIIPSDHYKPKYHISIRPNYQTMSYYFYTRQAIPRYLTDPSAVTIMDNTRVSSFSDTDIPWLYDNEFNYKYQIDLIALLRKKQKPWFIKAGPVYDIYHYKHTKHIQSQYVLNTVLETLYTATNSPSSVSSSSSSLSSSLSSLSSSPHQLQQQQQQQPHQHINLIRDIMLNTAPNGLNPISAPVIAHLLNIIKHFRFPLPYLDVSYLSTETWPVISPFPACNSKQNSDSIKFFFESKALFSMIPSDQALTSIESSSSSSSLLTDGKTLPEDDGIPSDHNTTRIAHDNTTTKTLSLPESTIHTAHTIESSLNDIVYSSPQGLSQTLSVTSQTKSGLPLPSHIDPNDIGTMRTDLCNHQYVIPSKISLCSLVFGTPHLLHFNDRTVGKNEAIYLKNLGPRLGLHSIYSIGEYEWYLAAGGILHYAQIEAYILYNIFCHTLYRYILHYNTVNQAQYDKDYNIYQNRLNEWNTLYLAQHQAYIASVNEASAASQVTLSSEQAPAASTKRKTKGKKSSSVASSSKRAKSSKTATPSMTSLDGSMLPNDLIQLPSSAPSFIPTAPIVQPVPPPYPPIPPKPTPPLLPQPINPYVIPAYINDGHDLSSIIDVKSFIDFALYEKIVFNNPSSVTPSTTSAAAQATQQATATTTGGGPAGQNTSSTAGTTVTAASTTGGVNSGSSSVSHDLPNTPATHPSSDALDYGDNYDGYDSYLAMENDTGNEIQNDDTNNSQHIAAGVSSSSSSSSSSAAAAAAPAATAAAPPPPPSQQSTETISQSGNLHLLPITIDEAYAIYAYQITKFIQQFSYPAQPIPPRTVIPSNGSAGLPGPLPLQGKRGHGNHHHSTLATTGVATYSGIASAQSHVVAHPSKLSGLPISSLSFILGPGQVVPFNPLDPQSNTSPNGVCTKSSAGGGTNSGSNGTMSSSSSSSSSVSSQLNIQTISGSSTPDKPTEAPLFSNINPLLHPGIIHFVNIQNSILFGLFSLLLFSCNIHPYCLLHSQTFSLPDILLDTGHARGHNLTVATPGVLTASQKAAASNAAAAQQAMILSSKRSGRASTRSFSGGSLPDIPYQKPVPVHSQYKTSTQFETDLQNVYFLTQSPISVYQNTEVSLRRKLAPQYRYNHFNTLLHYNLYNDPIFTNMPGDIINLLRHEQGRTLDIFSLSRHTLFLQCHYLTIEWKRTHNGFMRYSDVTTQNQYLLCPYIRQTIETSSAATTSAAQAKDKKKKIVTRRTTTPKDVLVALPTNTTSIDTSIPISSWQSKSSTKDSSSSGTHSSGNGGSGSGSSSSTSSSTGQDKPTERQSSHHMHLGYNHIYSVLHFLPTFENYDLLASYPHTMSLNPSPLPGVDNDESDYYLSYPYQAYQKNQQKLLHSIYKRNNSIECTVLVPATPEPLSEMHPSLDNVPSGMKTSHPVDGTSTSTITDASTTDNNLPLFIQSPDQMGNSSASQALGSAATDASSSASLTEVTQPQLLVQREVHNALAAAAASHQQHQYSSGSTSISSSVSSSLSSMTVPIPLAPSSSSMAYDNSANIPVGSATCSTLHIAGTMHDIGSSSSSSSSGTADIIMHSSSISTPPPSVPTLVSDLYHIPTASLFGDETDHDNRHQLSQNTLNDSYNARTPPLTYTNRMPSLPSHLQSLQQLSTGPADPSVSTIYSASFTTTTPGGGNLPGPSTIDLTSQSTMLSPNAIPAVGGQGGPISTTISPSNGLPPLAPLGPPASSHLVPGGVPALSLAALISPLTAKISKKKGVTTFHSIQSRLTALSIEKIKVDTIRLQTGYDLIRESIQRCKEEIFKRKMNQRRKHAQLRSKEQDVSLDDVLSSSSCLPPKQQPNTSSTSTNTISSCDQYSNNGIGSLESGVACLTPPLVTSSITQSNDTNTHQSHQQKQQQSIDVYPSSPYIAPRRVLFPSTPTQIPRGQYDPSSSPTSACVRPSDPVSRPTTLTSPQDVVLPYTTDILSPLPPPSSSTVNLASPGIKLMTNRSRSMSNMVLNIIISRYIGLHTAINDLIYDSIHPTVNDTTSSSPRTTTESEIASSHGDDDRHTSDHHIAVTPPPQCVDTSSYVVDYVIPFGSQGSSRISPYYTTPSALKSSSSSSSSSSDVAQTASTPAVSSVSVDDQPPLHDLSLGTTPDQPTLEGTLSEHSSSSSQVESGTATPHSELAILPASSSSSSSMIDSTEQSSSYQQQSYQSHFSFNINSIYGKYTTLLGYLFAPYKDIYNVLCLANTALNTTQNNINIPPYVPPSRPRMVVLRSSSASSTSQSAPTSRRPSVVTQINPQLDPSTFASTVASAPLPLKKTSFILDTELPYKYSQQYQARLVAFQTALRKLSYPQYMMALRIIGRIALPMVHKGTVPRSLLLKAGVMTQFGITTRSATATAASTIALSVLSAVDPQFTRQLLYESQLPASSLSSSSSTSLTTNNNHPDSQSGLAHNTQPSRSSTSSTSSTTPSLLPSNVPSQPAIITLPPPPPVAKNTRKKGKGRAKGSSAAAAAAALALADQQYQLEQQLQQQQQQNSSQNEIPNDGSQVAPPPATALQHDDDDINRTDVPDISESSIPSTPFNELMDDNNSTPTATMDDSPTSTVITPLDGSSKLLISGDNNNNNNTMNDDMLSTIDPQSIHRQDIDLDDGRYGTSSGQPHTPSLGPMSTGTGLILHDTASSLSLPVVSSPLSSSSPSLHRPTISSPPSTLQSESPRHQQRHSNNLFRHLLPYIMDPKNSTTAMIIFDTTSYYARPTSDSNSNITTASSTFKLRPTNSHHHHHYNNNTINTYDILPLSDHTIKHIRSIYTYLSITNTILRDIPTLPLVYERYINKQQYIHNTLYDKYLKHDGQLALYKYYSTCNDINNYNNLLFITQYNYVFDPFSGHMLKSSCGISLKHETGYSIANRICVYSHYYEWQRRLVEDIKVIRAGNKKGLKNAAQHALTSQPNISIGPLIKGLPLPIQSDPDPQYYVTDPTQSYSSLLLPRETLHLNHLTYLFQTYHDLFYWTNNANCSCQHL